jgi:multimeric flavodoxin WrbA
LTILGISASGRPNGITSEAVKALLEATGEPCDYVSLAGMTINGCRGCTACAADNRCIHEDDWQAVGDKMLAADAIVFGAPNYYGSINALGHACLERTFCFRHREVFLLAGKLGVAVAVDGGKQDNAVLAFIHKMMEANHIAVIGSVHATGYAQCYTCGFGEDCAVGGVVGRHGFLDEITPDVLPARFAEQERAQFQAYRVGKTLGSILKARNINSA